MIQIGLIILLTIIVLKSLFSFKFEKDDFSKTMEELKSEFRYKHLLALFGFWVLTIGLIISLTLILELLKDTLYSSDKEALFLIKPDMAMLLVMSMMASFGLAAYFVFLIIKITLKDRSKDYWLFYNRMYRFKHASNLLKYLAIILVFCSSTVICLGLNSYVKFKQDKIEINGFLDLTKKTYPIESISKIIHFQKRIAPNGNIIEKSNYKIIFQNGVEWETNGELEASNILDTVLFKFLCESRVKLLML